MCEDNLPKLSSTVSWPSTDRQYGLPSMTTSFYGKLFLKSFSRVCFTGCRLLLCCGYHAIAILNCLSSIPWQSTQIRFSPWHWMRRKEDAVEVCAGNPLGGKRGQSVRAAAVLDNHSRRLGFELGSQHVGRAHLPISAFLGPPCYYPARKVLAFRVGGSPTLRRGPLTSGWSAMTFSWNARVWKKGEDNAEHASPVSRWLEKWQYCLPGALAC